MYVLGRHAYYYCTYFSVINARHQFYDGTTSIPVDSSDPMGRKRVTNLLCMTLSPEEKRKIIGDTFIKVCILKGLFLIVTICEISYLVYQN